MNTLINIYFFTLLILKLGFAFLVTQRLEKFELLGSGIIFYILFYLGWVIKRKSNIKYTTTTKTTFYILLPIFFMEVISLFRGFSTSEWHYNFLRGLSFLLEK